MKRCLLFAIVLLLAACATPPRNPLAMWVPSRNHNPRGPVLIVIHATTQDSVHESLDTLRSRNSNGPVSSHYLIGRDGKLFQLVADQDRAWHAGAGRWGTITDVNSASIGIELDNDMVSPFPDAQIETLLVLLDDLTRRLRIPRYQVIAHADMAPTRKVDPGALFPWQTLARAGFGVWPDAEVGPPPPGFDAWLAMARFGYPLDDREAAVRAFRLRFRGIASDSGGVLDEEDIRILYALTGALGFGGKGQEQEPPPSQPFPRQGGRARERGPRGGAGTW